MSKLIEFWAIDKNNCKWNEYIRTKHSKKNKILKQIGQKFNIDVEKCIEFGMRKVEEI